MLCFAAIAPHPPLLLPSVGSGSDRKKVKNTIKALQLAADRMKSAKPDIIIISSPHQDWGFQVPLHFLAQNFSGEIRTFLTGMASAQEHFKKGKELYQKLPGNKRCAFIASGDLSHRLKEDGPYGFNADGPKFDQALIESLKKKDLETFLKLDELYPEAGECGLRSFSFLLGSLETAQADWRAEILSYEGPFGVGYLVANFNLQKR